MTLDSVAAFARETTMKENGHAPMLLAEGDKGLVVALFEQPPALFELLGKHFPKIRRAVEINPTKPTEKSMSELIVEAGGGAWGDAGRKGCVRSGAGAEGGGHLSQMVAGNPQGVGGCCLQGI